MEEIKVNNIIDQSELSNDSEGFPDNLARGSEVENLEYSTDHVCFPGDPGYDSYMDESHDYFIDSNCEDGFVDDSFYVFDGWFFDEDDESIRRNVCFDIIPFDGSYELTLVFDGKFYEKTIYVDKYTFKVNLLALFLHNQCQINNFNLIHKCKLLSPYNSVRADDVVHVNGGFDKYLDSSWNRIMHALNGNIRTSMKVVKTKGVFKSNNIERNKERTHLPTLKDKIKTRFNEKLIGINKFDYGITETVGQWQTVGYIPKRTFVSKVHEEVSNRDFALNRARVDITSPVEKKEVKEEEANIKEGVKDDAPVINVPNFGKLERKCYEYSYVLPNLVPVVEAHRDSTWFNKFPKLMLVPAGPDSLCRFNAVIFYFLLYLICCLSDNYLVSLIWVLIKYNKTINFIYDCYCGRSILKFKYIKPFINYFVFFLLRYTGLSNFWTVWLLLFVYKNYRYYKHHERLYNFYYKYGQFLNITLKPRVCGMTYFTRKVTLIRSRPDLDVEYIKDVDFRRNVDTNFKINQQTQMWEFKELLTKSTDVGYWDDNMFFVVEKTFEDNYNSTIKVADLELISQMCTSKNVSLNSSGEILAEKLMNCTNMGPFINYDRGNIFYNDILNESAKLAHCMIMSYRGTNVETDIYNQLFRKGDTMRLISIANRYSLYN
jgi:hypothetical protein